ncbi:hypothetical protein F4W66_25005 (plasmid) [Escherichia coli]|nr:hypothetical protein F4W66_25005 [Escherichia coli]
MVAVIRVIYLALMLFCAGISLVFINHGFEISLWASLGWWIVALLLGAVLEFRNSLAYLKHCALFLAYVFLAAGHALGGRTAVENHYSEKAI